MFELKPHNELLQLLNAGASFSIKAHLKPQNERLQLANAARTGGGHLKLLGLNLVPQNELLQLANAGKGHISFEDQIAMTEESPFPWSPENPLQVGH